MLVVIATLLLVASLKALKDRVFPDPNLPPGSLGWPLIGETIAFVPAGQQGKPEKFIRERMERHGSEVFKTSLLGQQIVVFCGQAGNKFLFSNENRLVNVWWPASVRKLFGSSLLNVVGDEAKAMRGALMSFLNPDALRRYLERMDMVTQQHISMHWQGKADVVAHPAVKLYTFELACRLFASMDDPSQISRLADHFSTFLKGAFGFAIDIPGTAFYNSTRAGDAIREEIRLMVRERRQALNEKRVSPTQDLLSHLLVTQVDDNGRLLSEMEIVDNTLVLFFAGHDTTASAISLLMRRLDTFEPLKRGTLRTPTSHSGATVIADEKVAAAYHNKKFQGTINISK